MIVDDSVVVRGLLVRWLEASGEVDVVRSVADGAQAVQHLVTSNAEIVILDIDMPVLNGIDAVPKLLEAQPNAKILISSTLSRRNAAISMKALSLGAADFVPKPNTVRGVTTSEEFKGELIAKVKALGAAARGRVEDRRARLSSTIGRLPAGPQVQPEIQLRRFSNVVPQVLAIGSSTGGPQALQRLFTSLAGKISVPVLVTQHMPPAFTGILAEQIAKCCDGPAKEAEDGDVLESGRVLVAPGGFHLTVQRSGSGVSVTLDEGPAVNFCKPAVDPMLRSLANAYGPAVLAVVLTGMGHDGRVGAQDIANAGGAVVVQDQASSVVWGMPGAVAEAGLASAILPLEEIGPKLIGLLKGTSL